MESSRHHVGDSCPERKDEGPSERAGHAVKSEPRLADGLLSKEAEGNTPSTSPSSLSSLSSSSSLLLASDPAHNNNPAVAFSVGGGVSGGGGGNGGVGGGSRDGSGSVGKAGPAPVSLSQILQRSGGGGGGGAPTAGVGVSQAPSERAASHPPALVPSHQQHQQQQQQQQQHSLYQYKAHQPNFTSSIAGVRIMGHGASCLTGSAAPASSSSTNNCSVSSFTPLQRNQPTQQKVGGSTVPTASSATTAGSSTHHQPTTTMHSSSTSTNQTIKNVPDDYQYLCNLVPELKTELKERESRLELYQTETLELKRRLKKRDEEIGRLQREIHKLKVSLKLFPAILSFLFDFVRRRLPCRLVTRSTNSRRTITRSCVCVLTIEL